MRRGTQPAQLHGAVGRTEEPSGQNTAGPCRLDHVPGGHTLVLLLSGCAQQLSGGIWSILPSHMELLSLKTPCSWETWKDGVPRAAQ